MSKNAIFNTRQVTVVGFSIGNRVFRGTQSHTKVFNYVQVDANASENSSDSSDNEQLMVDYLPTDFDCFADFESEELRFALEGNDSEMSTKVDEFLLAVCICHQASRVQTEEGNIIFKSLYADEEA
jgi:hypothetical protein